MEAADAPTTAAVVAAVRKGGSLQLATAVRLLLEEGEMDAAAAGGQRSSSSCCSDFEEENHGEGRSVGERITDSNGRNSSNSSHNSPPQAAAQQQHRRSEGSGGQYLPLTRFEQQAEQLLQQDQGLHMDQILDLLSLLLKQQQSTVEKDACLPPPPPPQEQQQQQNTTTLCAAALGCTAKIQAADNHAASPSFSTAALDIAAAAAASCASRPWGNRDLFSLHSLRSNADCHSLVADADAGVAAHADTPTMQDNFNEGLMRRSENPQQQENTKNINKRLRDSLQQRRPSLMNSQAAAIAAAADNEIYASHVRVLRSSGGGRLYDEEEEEQQQQGRSGGGGSAWTAGSSGHLPQQQQLQRLTLSAAAAACTDREREGLFSESSNNTDSSGTNTCMVERKQKSRSCSSSQLQEEAEAAADLATIGTRLREARQLQRQQLQLQQSSPQQQQSPSQQQKTPLQQQQFLSQQEQPLSQQRHSLSQPQQPLLQRHMLSPDFQREDTRQQCMLQPHQMLHQLDKQQKADQLRSDWNDEGLLDDEQTRQILSKSLDALIGGVNVQTLKDLILRKETAKSTLSRSSGESGGEGSHRPPTIGGSAAASPSVNAAVPSLQHHQQEDRRLLERSSEQQGLGGAAAGKNCAAETRKERQRTQVESELQHKEPEEGAEVEEELAFLGVTLPPGAAAAVRRLTVKSREMHVDETGARPQLQHLLLQQQPQQQLQQQQLHQHLLLCQQQQQHVRRLQQKKQESASLQTSNVCQSAQLERGAVSCNPSGPLAEFIRNESFLNNGQSAAAAAVAEAAAAAAAAAAGNKRVVGGMQRKQQQQQAEKKRGRSVRLFLARDSQEGERLLPTNGSKTAGLEFAADFPCNSAAAGNSAEQDEQETYREMRRARLCAAAGRGGERATSVVEASYRNEDLPLSPRRRSTAVSVYRGNGDVATASITALSAKAAGLAYHAGIERSRDKDEQQQAAADRASRAREQQLSSVPAAAFGRKGQEEENAESFRSLSNVAVSGSSSGTSNIAGAIAAAEAAGENRRAGTNLLNTERRLPSSAKEALLLKGGTAAEPEGAKSCLFFSPTSYSRRRRAQESCELALAAARLAQQGHTFTPPFYLGASSSGASTGGSSNRSSNGIARETCKRSDATAGGGEEKKEGDLVGQYEQCDAGSGCEAARSGAAAVKKQQDRLSAEDDQRDKVAKAGEEEEEVVEEPLTQQQLALLKHIYCVLSEAEEYFSFKSALYQLHIKRHLKKCVSSLAAAAAAAGATSEVATPHMAGGGVGGSKHHRSSIATGTTQSKAIRLFNCMPPIPINAVEQRALLSVRKHLHAGGGGAILCQGDGLAQLLMEELDELLTSLVNKLLLIIVVKFQTCFIHAPARAQLREFLVSFVFPGDLPTQLLFRDHVQAVVHARIRHFRDSVGRTLRHQPPPCTPLAIDAVPRSGMKRVSNRVAAGTAASSPANRETEEEADEEEDKLKKQKVCAGDLVEVEGREGFNCKEIGAYLETRGSPSSNCRRKISPASTNDAPPPLPSHHRHHISSISSLPEARAGGQAKQQSSSSGSSKERRASPAIRSPSNKEKYRGGPLNSGSTVKNPARTIEASSGFENRKGAAISSQQGNHVPSRSAEEEVAAAAAATATSTTAGDAFSTVALEEEGGAGGGKASQGGDLNSRTRARPCNGRKRGPAATAGRDAVESNRHSSGSSSRSGSAAAAATRRCGSSTDRSSHASSRQNAGVANQRQQQQQRGREAASSSRRGGAATLSTTKPSAKENSGVAASAERNNPRSGSSSAADFLQQKGHTGSGGQKMEGQHQGERMTRGWRSADYHSGRSSPTAVAQRRSFTPVRQHPQRGANSQQQQQQNLLQHQQSLQRGQHAGSEKQEGGGSRHYSGSSGHLSEEREEVFNKAGQLAVAGAAANDLSCSRSSNVSILSRGSTRESAGDPGMWEQSEPPRLKGGGAKIPLQNVQPSLSSSASLHLTTKRQSVADREAGDGGGEGVLSARAGGREGRGNLAYTLSVTANERSEEEEAAQVLAAALGETFNKGNGDNPTEPAGEMWEWLAVAAASKDEYQQEELKQTLETLLNAWTAGGSWEESDAQGTHGSRLANSSSSNSKVGGTNGSSAPVGLSHPETADFPYARLNMNGRSHSAGEVNLDHLDSAGNAVRFSGAGLSAKDASLPSPSSVNGPPSEASTSLPLHEERTPSAERCTAAAAEADVVRSFAAAGSSSPRGSTVGLATSSVRVEKTTAAADRKEPLGRGRARVERGELERPLRLSLPKEVSRTDEEVPDERKIALENLSHSTIADFLLTYCKDDATAYEIASHMKHREEATPSAAAMTSATTAAAGSCCDGVHKEGYIENTGLGEKLLDSLPLAPAKLSETCTASNAEFPALLGEALAASQSGENPLAYSLSSLLTNSSPLQS